MNWEDTVMNVEHKTYQEGASFDTDYKVITKCIPDCPACISQSQAEITGDIAYKAGMKEIADEVGKFCYILYDENNKVHVCLDDKAWQAFKGVKGL